MGIDALEQEGLASRRGEDERRPRAETPAPYESPRLTVCGRLADLTKKRGGPGNDNPGHMRSQL